MATLKQIIDYSKANPNTDYAKQAYEHIKSGAFDAEAQKEGIDLSFAGRPALKKKESIAEKIGNFTGGTKIAQGLGQGLAQGENAKLLEQAQNMQFDIQGNLLKRIKEKKAKGEDTTRLEHALTLLDQDIAHTGATAEKTLNPENLTNKEVIGDALQLATTAVGGKVAGKIAGEATSGVGLVKGVIQGAKTGALSGAVLGGSTGVSQGLKENKSGGDIVKEGLGGAVSGALLGGTLGGITGGISGKIKAKPIKEDEFVKNLVSPKATAEIKEQALKEGRVTEAGLLKKSKILPGRRDKQLAEVASDYVSSKKPITENIDSIKQGVSDINEGVKAYVKKNKVPFNTKQLTSQLNKGKDELNLIFASDTNAEKTYNAVVKEFLKRIENKDTAGLLKVRQEFDKIPAIKKLLSSQGLGENVKKEVVLTVRDMANQYIAKLLPKTNQYRSKLLTESKLIEAIGNMADKNIDMIGKSKLELLVKEYPILKWVASGLVGAGGIGVGGAVIASSDH